MRTRANTVVDPLLGRYAACLAPDDLRELFALPDKPFEAPAEFVVAPGERVPVIRRRTDGERELVHLRWGLIPHWSHDPAIGQTLVNARCETVAMKPAFREGFARRRCLVVTDGLNEWQDQRRRPEPWLFTLKSGGAFGLAGLWERWRSPRGEAVQTVAVITTDANRLIAPVHTRMPVIIRPSDYATWLDPESDFETLDALLRPLPPDEMDARPIARSRVGTDDMPTLLDLMEQAYP